MSEFEKFLCRPSVVFLTGFLVGVHFAAGKKILPMIFFIIMCIIAGLVLLYGSGALSRGYFKRPVYYLTVWLIAPVFVLAGFERTGEAGIRSPLKEFLSRPVQSEVRGIISDVSLRTDGSLITISDSSAIIGGSAYQAEKIHIYSENRYYNEDIIGCHAISKGKLYPFEKPVNPGQFDSDAYYSARNIDAKLYASEVVVGDACSSDLVGKCRYSYLNALCNFRMRMCRGIYEILPQKEAGILSAMLLGERGLLDSDIKQLYSDGGIAHILSISALHVTLLGMGLFRLLMLITKSLRASCISTIMLTLTYGILSGFQVSTRRAVIMLCVNLVARLIFRAYDTLSACAFSALLILAAQPLYVYDSGFRMSFMAVCGIIFIKWTMDRYRIENPVLKAFLPCLSVFIFTLPVVMDTYYEISVYSLIINPVILVFMSMLLVSGFAAGGLSMAYMFGRYFSDAFGYVSSFFAGPVYFILRLYEMICEFERELPFSKIVTGAPEGMLTVLYYVFIAAGGYILIRFKKKAGVFVFILCGIIFIRLPQNGISVDHLDVGQGDCALICCEGKRMLVDGGSSSISNVGKYRIIPFLKHEGINKLDHVIASHFDLDHINGIIEMIETGYPEIGELIVPVNADRENKLLCVAGEKEIKISFVSAGDSIDFASQSMIIAPEAEVKYIDTNEGSVVAAISYGGFKMILTGDSGFESESRYVCNIGEGPVSVLKVSHHGSKYSTSEELLDALRPSAAVISCAKYNSYGHPAPETLERLQSAGTEVFVTCDCGMVSIRYEKGEDFFLCSPFLKFNDIEHRH